MQSSEQDIRKEIETLQILNYCKQVRRKELPFALLIIKIYNLNNASCTLSIPI